ncbi:cadherin-like protein 26 isoform X2 [Oreochromis niloticus]|uniref:cadherin-like protein 26 isoform X2 n=1 Tax=Oreochromis niloticus TaxID=8128 RepID=UPI00039438C6|nr:cadherin-like protein 26 isoform X2 [Oreochromis niloticus]
MRCFFLLVYCLSGARSSELLRRHRREWTTDSFELEEGYPGPFPYELGKVNIDRQNRLNFKLYGEGVDEAPMGVISIDKESGMLYVHKAVDYEEWQKLELICEARKMDVSTDTRQVTRLRLEIFIKDINDNPPRFENSLYETTVDQENTQGSNILKVHATDIDESKTLNSTFHYEIKSVSPNVRDTEFFVDKSGNISFKGCLNHEVAEKFTLMVEAIDHGEVVSLSSSTTVVIHVRDGNNHLPVFSDQTGTGKVKESETGVSPLRLHVTDKDTPHTSAWRARYTVHGDERENFEILTDLETNDGILTVVKPLDFENGAQRELLISVENEAPYYSCEVKERTPSGLWKVDTIKGHDPSGAAEPQSVKVTINVEDTNDPPEFNVTLKEVMVMENVPAGTWVDKVTAVDPDSSYSKEFVYKVGNDPAGWVTVNSVTGDITMIKTPDRESPHVVNGIYTILVYAVDKGIPPMTGTATLHIHVSDQNDNVPQLKVDSLDVCVSDAPTTTNIEAFDPDEAPYGGPFTFELLGNVEGKWRLNPGYGDTAGLVKEPGVYPGQHTIHLKISDMQGAFKVYNLSVTACDCTVTPNCQIRQNSEIKVGPYALCIIISSLLLLLFLLLLTFTISSKREFITMEPEDRSGGILLQSNTEAPGDNCEIPVTIMEEPVCMEQFNQSNFHIPLNGMRNGRYSAMVGMNEVQTFGSFRSLHSQPRDFTQRSIHPRFGNFRRESQYSQYSYTGNQSNWNFPLTTGYDSSHQFEDMGNMNVLQTQNLSCATESNDMQLHQKLTSLWEKEGDLLDDELHIYSELGDSDTMPELEAISISEEDSFQDTLEVLGPKFHQLASICMTAKDSQPKEINSPCENLRKESLSYQHSYPQNQSDGNSPITTGYDSSHQLEDMGNMNVLQSQNLICATESIELMPLHQTTSLPEKEGDLDSDLHIYAQEGDSNATSELNRISISEGCSYQDTLEDLGPMCHQLTSICSPTQRQDSRYYDI